MPDPQDPISETTSEKLGDYGAIVASLIPVVGGPMGGLAQKYLRDRQNKRLEEFLGKLTADLEKVKERLNKEFLTREEAKQLFEEVLSAAEQTAQKEKLEALESVLIVAFTSRVPSYSTASEIIDLIRSFQLRHIQMLHVLSDARAADVAMGRPVGDGGSVFTSLNHILHQLLPNMSDDEIVRTWGELYSRHIVKTPDTKGMITDQGIRQLENRLSGFGRQVADYICGTESD